MQRQCRSHRLISALTLLTLGVLAPLVFAQPEPDHPPRHDDPPVGKHFGRAALGEALYRLSDLVLDDTTTGAERFWREMGGLCINPMRGVNRLVSGRCGPPIWRASVTGARAGAYTRNQAWAGCCWRALRRTWRTSAGGNTTTAQASVSTAAWGSATVAGRCWNSAPRATGSRP